MQPNRRLSEILPLRFPNGQQISQFSKPCIRCGNVLSARDMVGAAQLLDEQIAIAAMAQCPSCGQRFPVTCLIDDQKQVRRVMLPYWIFNPYLRSLRPSGQGAGQGAKPEGDSMLTTLSAEMAEPVAPVPTPTPVAHDVERSEESVGHYQGRPIPAWVRVNGRQLAFVRVSPDARIREGEFLLDGCLVYGLQ